MSNLLEWTRIRVPDAEVKHRGPASGFFDVLPNNSGLTEEYLYTHQPTGRLKIPVYSTSRDPVGYLDDNGDVRQAFVVLEGPAILVARKGYGGRLSVIAPGSFIVHEDGYAIRPKVVYASDINLGWFAGHYSFEFQANRSSVDGIGDFPRAKLRAMDVVIPSLEWQLRCAPLYEQRDSILGFVDGSADRLSAEIDEVVSSMSPALSGETGVATGGVAGLQKT